MGIPTFTFHSERCPADRIFMAQCHGTDPYQPGQRSRTLLAEIMTWALDAVGIVDAVNNHGVALLTGLPVDPDLPDTPQDGRRTKAKTTFVSEGCLNGISKILGLQPVAFDNEKEGDLIHQIAPVPGKEKSVSNQGAGVFSMHTEGTHMSLPPHVLALVCLRNTEEGATNFTNLVAALAEAPPSVLAELRRPKFTQSMGVSSGGGGRYPLAITNGPPHDPIYRVDFTDVEATDPASWLALDWLRAAAVRHEEQVVLKPGDMVIMNNHRSLHGRVGFTPDYSANRQRWLQRQYMTRYPMLGKAADLRWPHVWRGD